MMRTFAALALGCGMLFGSPIGAAQAGVLELFKDEVSTSCNQHWEPCKRNHLGYRTYHRRAPYYRYGVKTTAARYVWRHERVMIAPPTVVTGYRRVRTHKINGKHLVPVTAAGHYRTVHPARYAIVTRRVLVAPARARVVRLAPHSAYFADTLIVKGSRCKRALDTLGAFGCH